MYIHMYMYLQEICFQSHVPVAFQSCYPVACTKSYDVRVLAFIRSRTSPSVLPPYNNNLSISRGRGPGLRLVYVSIPRA